MNTAKHCIAIFCAAVALFLTGCCTTPRATRWEYKVVSRPPLGFDQRRDPAEYRAKVEALLNDLGKDGWILVSQNEGQVFYFRRLVK